jgi:NADP-dependent 3-hydroxy acid dehydrogenase YdfG
MPDADQRLLAAEAAALAQRARAKESLAALKAKLNPRRVAKQALVDATVASESAAIASARTARRYPGPIAGLVAVAGLYLARHRIAQLFGRSPDRIEIDRTDRQETD